MGGRLLRVGHSTEMGNGRHSFPRTSQSQDRIGVRSLGVWESALLLKKEHGPLVLAILVKARRCPGAHLLSKGRVQTYNTCRPVKESLRRRFFSPYSTGIYEAPDTLAACLPHPLWPCPPYPDRPLRAQCGCYTGSQTPLNNGADASRSSADRRPSCRA